MIRRVLVPFDGSPASVSALSIAASMTGIVGADLQCLYVEDEARFADFSLAAAIAENVAAQPIISQPLPPEKMLEVENEVAKERSLLEKQALDLCAEAEVELEFISERGAPIETIAEAAKRVDLVVMGKVGLHRGKPHTSPGSTVEGLLRYTARPVLVVPEEPVGQSTVVVAYDGSKAADRALAAGAELASVCEMNEVHVLTVGLAEEQTRQLQSPVLDYLSAYGLAAKGVSASGKPADAIIAYAEKVDASVLVLGAFGSNKFKELLFGSTTREVLNYDSVATLLVS